MSPVARRSQRRSRGLPAANLLLPGLLIVTALAGLWLLAASAGWFDSEPTVRKSAPPGTVAAPVAAVRIPAYTRIGLEHLIDPATGDLRALFLPDDSILQGTIIDVKQLIGRVVATDKRPGQLFSEVDLFPPGTREGIVAGIPAGKRALRIDASKVNGIVGLARGDRFDLVATVDLRRDGSNRVAVEGLPSNELGTLASQVRSSTVVLDGAVVQPLETRSIAGKKEQLVEEMVIAVHPDEVQQLTSALHAGARVDCVPRSGRPIDPVAGATTQPDEGRRRGLQAVETISGGKRRVVAVPSRPPGRSSAPPVAAAPRGDAVDDSGGG